MPAGGRPCAATASTRAEKLASAVPSDRPADLAKASSAAAAQSSGTSMARKVSSADKGFGREAHAAQLGLLDQAPRDLLRRAAGGRRQAGLGHVGGDVLGQPVEVAVGDQRCDRLRQRAVLLGIGEVGERRRKLLGRAEGAGEPHAPAARQAERCQHRLEDRLVAERDGQWTGRAASSVSSACASASERASARAVSLSPRSSMPAWKNSLPPSRRWRNTSPR